MNKWGNVIYDEYVRPIDRVVDFRTEISGIRPCDLKKGVQNTFYVTFVFLFVYLFKRSFSLALNMCAMATYFNPFNIMCKKIFHYTSNNLYVYSLYKARSI